MVLAPQLFPTAVQAFFPAITAERRRRSLATDIDVLAGACVAWAGLDLRNRAAFLTLPAPLMAGNQDQATPALAWPRSRGGADAKRSIQAARRLRTCPSFKIRTELHRK